MASDTLTAEVEAAFSVLNLSQTQRHAFLCVGPNCCETEQGLAVWDYLKKALKERRLSVLRTKASCLRICAGGPWMLVYPEGTWYGGLTVERCERIVAEHLDQGKPVSEWAVKTRTLNGGSCATP